MFFTGGSKRRQRWLGRDLRKDDRKEGDASMKIGNLQEVPMLVRREIEGLIAVPLIREYEEKLGTKEARKVAEKVICEAATAQGKQMAAMAGGNTLSHFSSLLPMMQKGGDLKMEIIDNTEDCLRYIITECEYAKLYKRMGMEEYGVLMCCSRDSAKIKGFNPEIEFVRTGTIMEGEEVCDFCLRKHREA